MTAIDITPEAFAVFAFAVLAVVLGLDWLVRHRKDRHGRS